MIIVEPAAAEWHRERRLTIFQTVLRTGLGLATCEIRACISVDTR